jgi:hypothetical protein
MPVSAEAKIGGVRAISGAIYMSPNTIRKGFPILAQSQHIGHAYYKYYAFVRPEALRTGWNRDRILS